MKDGVIIQQVCKRPEWEHNKAYWAAVEMCRPRHQAYADKWGFDFLTVHGEVRDDWLPNNGGWAKVELIRKMLAQGYKYICWIDADAMIIDMDTDLRDGCPEGLGMVLHNGPGTPGPHLNVGVMLIQNTERVRALFDEWASRYPGTTEFPWYEQGEAHKMAHDPKWMDVIIKIENKWNSCIYAQTQVDNPVIEGWHGMGTGQQRYEQMKAFFEKLPKIETEGGKTGSVPNGARLQGV